MQPQTYIERAADVVAASQIAVQVFLSQANDDLMMVPLRPVPVQLSARISEGEFMARQLRSVCVVGLCGLQARVAFEEELEPHVEAAVADAFAEYCRVLAPQFFDHVAKAQAQLDAEARAEAQAEIVELELLFLLPDLRHHIASA